MNIPNLNLKLLVLDVLLENGHFKDEIAALDEKYWREDDYSYQPIPEILEFCKNIELTEAQLASVTALCPDGGNEIYHTLMANWDGEDDTFDVTSFEGIELLPNLETLSIISMVTAKDIEPLLKCPSLKLIQYYSFDKAQVAALNAKGIEVK